MYTVLKTRAHFNILPRKNLMGNNFIHIMESCLITRNKVLMPLSITYMNYVKNKEYMKANYRD